MTPDAWEDEGRSEPRRGVPAWALWGCGGGCLLVTLLVIGFAVFAGRLLRDAVDPEKAWSGLAELLPFDERPADWEVFGTTRAGIGFYVLRSEGVFLLVQRAREHAEIAAMLAPDSPANIGTWFLDPLVDPEPGTIVLQGREAPCLRFRGGLAQVPEDATKVDGSGIRIDVTGAGVPTLLHLAVAGAGERVSDERVNELLAPFDVWRGR